jgi:hypothetical protein
MWRPAHGATNRPGPSRPTSGYGRALGRPGPWIPASTDEPPATACAPSPFDDLVRELVGGVRAADSETEAPRAGHSVIADSASANPGAPGPVPAT